MGGDFEAGWLALGAAGVDAEHNALGAESGGEFPQKFGAGDGGGIDAYFVGTGAKQLVDVVDAAHSPADGEWDEDLFGGAAHHVEHGAAAGDGGGYVEEGEFVGPLPVVAGGELHWVAGVFQAGEIDSLDHAPVIDVEAGNDSDCYRHGG